MRSSATVILGSVAAVAAGCKKPAPPPPPAAPPSPTAMTAPASAQPPLQFSVVQRLAPGLRTHVYCGPDDTIYWLQEGGDDALHAWRAGAAANTVVSAARIAGSLGIAGGTIESLAPGPAEAIMCYFSATVAGRPVAAVALFRDTHMRILADTSAIAAASGLGDALGQARGTLLATVGPRGLPVAYLWLRDAQDDVMLAFDPVAAAAGAPAALRKAWDHVAGPTDRVRLCADNDDLVAAPDGTLFYLDRPGVEIWHINPLNAVATPIQSLDGYPGALTPPAPPAADGRERLFLLAGNSNPMSMPGGGAPARPAVTEFPALLVVADQQLRAVTYDCTAWPSDLPLSSMQPQSLVPTSPSDTWIIYDHTSGQLLRLHWNEHP